MPGKKKAIPDLSTEEKIKEAARKVFLKKGYAAARTRDIAEEAGINLALLNYYFRSKEKLFELVMVEKMQKLLGVISTVINDETTTLEEKLDLIASHYIDMLLSNPDLPLFVLSELRSGGEHLIKRFQFGGMLIKSSFFKQLQEKRPDTNPLQLLLTLLGSLLFPFIAKPIFQSVGNVGQKEFDTLMLDRKNLVPKWMKAILKAK